MVIPAPLREALHLVPGDELSVSLEPESRELRLMSISDSINHARKLVRQYVPGGRSLVEELLTERRLEAEGEQQPA